MPKPENLIGKGFESRPENINTNGRPKRGVALINEQLKDKGITPLTKGQVEDIMLNLLNMEEEELKVMVNDKKTPFIIRLCIKEMMEKSKGFSALNIMLDRGIGKAMQKTETDNNIKGEISISGLLKDLTKPDITKPDITN